jgi:glyoxylase-like metal-dependent hydrolase (beta-lactamase superfamily II)
MTFETTLGGARIRQVTELARWPFPAEGLFPEVTADQVAVASGELGPAFVDETTQDLILAIHTYVVELGEATIVVDTGNGNGRDRPNLLPHHMFDTDYLDLLEATVDLGKVTVVINTHLHPDHCGWNTRMSQGAWVPTFPNATYVFNGKELAALQALVTNGAANGVEEDLIRMYDDSIRPVLEGSRYETFNGEHVLANSEWTSVVAVTSPGHTVGHSVIEVRSGQATAVMSGDIIHHPIQLIHPELTQAGDSDPGTAAQARTDLLARCTTGDVQLLPSHFPINEPVRIGPDGNLLDQHDEGVRRS